MQFSDIKKLVESELVQTDLLIERCLQAEISTVQEVGKHLIQSGGKRLRPQIVLLTALAVGYQGTGHIELAAILELIHTATLLHDDVVDASELRRGHRTANAVWGNALSVLVGDFLYSRAFQLMVQLQDAAIMNVLARATNDLAQGEIRQLLNVRRTEITEETYFQVIRDKTGVLFATAAQVSAVLAKQSKEIVQGLYDYGLHLGIAFQLVDDVLDYFTASEMMGKNRGDDLSEGKMTLPLIVALKRASDSEKNFLRDVITHADITKLDEVCAMIESTGAIPYTYELAEKEAEKAVLALKEIPLPPSSYREALFALPQLSVERKA